MKIQTTISILLLFALILTFGCGDSITQPEVSIIKITDTETTIELTDNQICEYICTTGEDGARIKTQAKNYVISEINKNSETGYASIYRYKPKANYVGYDFVEIEILPDVVPIDEPPIYKIVKLEFYIK